MPVPPDFLAMEWRQAACRMRALLDHLFDPSHPGPIVVTSEEISTLSTELQQSERLRSEQRGIIDAAIAHAISEYRKQIERLRDLLPTISDALRAEQARLEEQSERMRAASEWSHSSNQTLQPPLQK